ncbi:uncharacterized protein HMF8227_02951 [Saliniradius amylolyticus]|uniref:Ubiquinone biosynthesis accessory factor UbiK n=1 Tax=Saliniradius amylolyticus TaxID=2183582 RepID=A0A2S2E714_9ALTE|nr:accessory factor UbiK family protein [Saliniradius amylolyticus]AWL13399.1 uncharacterized protein HMF8227_02951 [Saliniradius amylolyticus]
MIDPKKLEQIAKQVTDAIPPGVKTMAEDMEGRVKQVLQSQLGKLDMVTREEFEVQTQVLLRTREKLAQLETRLEKLEQKPEPDSPSS